MRIPFLLLAFLCFNCAKDRSRVDPVHRVLKSDKKEIKQVIDKLQNHELQILFTEINRDNDSIIFKDYQYNIDDSLYFYPASSVKFPVAVLALEKLNADGLYTLETPFYVEGDSAATTIKNEIDKIFAVSDNQAYNRLFEYLGKDYINKKLLEKGLVPSRISHRLSTDNAYNLETKPLIFYENDSTLTPTESVNNRAIEALKLRKIIKGKGYMVQGELVSKPFDFSLKNYLPITTLHNTMKRVIFPDLFQEKEQFHLHPADRKFLLKSMSTLPKELGYNTEEYYDSYGKFFIYGDSKVTIPEHIKIYNKVGYAYGYLTDCAYIKDEKNDIDFLVTATIFVNENGVFNDDIYEYETIGIPFLAELGRQLYEYEITKK